MAGTLAVAEIMKAQISRYPFHGNFVYLDLKGPLNMVELSQRQKFENCICTRQNSLIYRSIIADSRWASLSNVRKS
jgi:hypothetical protein